MEYRRGRVDEYLIAWHTVSHSDSISTLIPQTMSLSNILLIAVATGLAIVGTDAKCPADIPAVYADITQIYKNSRDTYKWIISPTNHAKDADGQTSPCTSAAYISQWDGNGCSSSCAEKEAPTAGKDTCDYAFNDGTSGNRIMKIHLACNPNDKKLKMAETVDVTNAGMTNLEYVFKGTYAGVCEGGGDDDGDGGGDKKSGGCGGGCVFVILFFVGAFLYVAGTVAFNYFKQGKRGKELAPHPEFWLLIPGLIKDGAVFSFQMVTKPCRKDSGGSSYTQV